MSKVLEGDYIPAGEELPQVVETNHDDRQKEALRKQGFAMSEAQRQANIQRQMGGAGLAGAGASILGALWGF